MSIAQSITSSLVYKILNVITVFLINIMLSRLAGADGLGILAYTIAALSIYNLATSFGLESGITYSTASKKIPSEKIISVIVLIVILQIAAGFLFDWLADVFFGKKLFIYRQVNYFFVTVVLLAGISLTEKFSALLLGKNLIRPLNAALFFSNLGTLIVLVSCKLIGYKLSMIEVLEIYIGLTFLQAIVLIVLYYAYTSFQFSFSFLNAGEVKVLFSYAIVTFISNLIQSMAYRIDYWLIAYYLKNESSLGLYAQAVKLSQLFWILPLFFASVIFPVIARNKTFTDTARLTSLIRVMNAVNFAGCFVAFFAADWLMPFLFGNQFAASSYPFKLLLPGVFLFTNTTIIAAYFAGMNRLKINLAGSCICLLTVLSLDIILIPRYGIAGASIATAISYGLTTVYFIAVFLKESNSSIMNLLFFTRKDVTSILRLLKLPASKYSVL